MNALIESDWKKHAAAATQSDADIEKAFLDQAWMSIQNKAAPLMRPQNRVGFEIVHKNDANTRMVGVFVFRIDKDYLFVLVFFINGSIKGTDLLYRSNVKRFVPLNNEWCDYLVQLQTGEEGVGVSQRQRQLTRDQLNLLDVVEPPNLYRHHRKYAAVSDDAAQEDWVRENVNEMLEKLATGMSEPQDSILRRFILEHGRHSAIRKIANAAKVEFDFARALMLGSSPENYMPELPPPEAKKASGPLVVFHSSVLKNPRVKQASPKQMCAGYVIEDNRKEAEVNDVVYTDNEQDLSTVEAPGVYDTLLIAGTSSRCLIGFEWDVNLNGKDGPQPVCYNEDFDPNRPNMRRLSLVVIDDSSRASTLARPSSQAWVFGKYVGKIDDSGALIDLGQAEIGQAYRIYNQATQGFSQAFYVTEKVDDPSGLKGLRIVTNNTKDTPGYILSNPDFPDYDPKDNIFGSKCKLVRVDFKLTDSSYPEGGKRVEWNSNLGLGNKHTLNAFIFQNGYKSASVKMLPNGRFLVKSARTKGHWSQELSEASAKVKLMLDCAVRESVAEELMKQAAEMYAPSINFLYDGKKIASNLRFNDWPDFYERTNDEFGVLEGPRSDHVLSVDQDWPIADQHRVGDVWRQEPDSNESLDTLNPMQLYQMSQEKGMGSLFEHGVVGELIKTYDAVGIVQSYIPDFETALDRLGRIMFLLYWKPEDFAQAYGTDDQTSMENKLLSNFRAIGELTLELLQKAKLQQTGTVSLA